MGVSVFCFVFGIFSILSFGEAIVSENQREFFFRITNCKTNNYHFRARAGNICFGGCCQMPPAVVFCYFCYVRPAEQYFPGADTRGFTPQVSSGTGISRSSLAWLLRLFLGT